MTSGKVDAAGKLIFENLDGEESVAFQGQAEPAPAEADVENDAANVWQAGVLSDRV